MKRFLSELKFGGMAPTSIMFYKDVGHSQEGVKEVTALLEAGAFDGPKPVRLMERLLTLANLDDDSIILDFFSGSASTAHAVMKTNAEKDRHCNYIMVQLPESTSEDGTAFKAGYKNICEIGKERIRRAGKKIKADSPLTTQDLDTGFRVLKLDSTNMQDVYYTPHEYTQKELDGLIDNIKPDRTPEDLLFQVMLDLGILLSSSIDVKDIDGKRVYYVNGNYLIACFESVNDELVTKIARAKPDYAVFRDSSFASDSTLVNFEQIFKTYSPATIRKVL
jgi:adenine-specific DNA-methyltransferase